MNAICISQENWDKIIDYAAIAWKESKSEIGGMAMVYKDKDDDYIIDNPVILKQEISASNTVLDKEALAGYYVKTAMEHKDKRDLQFLWWHSHHTMAAFWSGTDLATIKEFNGGKSSMSLVVNLREEYKMRVNIWDPIEAHEDVELTFIGETKREIKDKSLIKEVKALCQKEKPSTTLINGYTRYKANNNQGSFGWLEYASTKQTKEAQELIEWNRGFSPQVSVIDDVIEELDKLIDEVTAGEKNYNQYKYKVSKLVDKLTEAGEDDIGIKHLTEKQFLESMGTFTAIDLIVDGTEYDIV